MIAERPPIFTIHSPEDGPLRVTVDYWPDKLQIVAHLVDEPSAPPGREAGWVHIERDGDQITIAVDNGEATYRIDALDAAGLYHATALKRSWWAGEKPA